MPTPLIIPVILSGGSGTRLWPLSRNAKPKQFLKLVGEHTMIQETMLRCKGGGFDQRPIFVAAEAHRFMVAEAAQELGISSDILLEPMRRDSCAAVIAGALQAAARDEEALVLVVAADHHIPDGEAFRAQVLKAAEAARQGYIVTFGIRPKSPATGYGYILPGEETGFGKVARVSRFVEKPNSETAKSYLAQGYLWNSGNFLFQARHFLDEAARLASGVVAAVSKSLEAARRDLDFLRLEPEAFASSPQISVDFAIMEKTEKAAVLPVDYAWSDIGSWDAVAQNGAADPDGNVITGNGAAWNARNVLIHAEGRLATVLGCDDIVLVSTRDAVLVAKRGETEKVKDFVAKLQELGHAEATETPRHYRPWGYHELLDQGQGFEVRRVVLAPGQGISRQSHEDRAEHWVVVEGNVEATLGGDVFHLGEGQSIMVGRGTLHQVRNKGEKPAFLIEVHTREKA